MDELHRLPPHGMTPFPRHIRPLTTLRFFAALMIVYLHLWNFAPFSDIAPKQGKTYLAVDFFFMLSGFILTHVYGHGLVDGTLSPLTFYRRRFARIYPVHLLILVVMAVIGLTRLKFGPISFWDGREYPVEDLFLHLLLIQAWGSHHTMTFNAPSWSVSAESFAYLLFPILIGPLTRLPPRLLLAGAVIAYIAIWCVSWSLAPLRPITLHTEDWSEFRILPEFAIGMALYLFAVSRPPVGRARMIFLICVPVLSVLLFAGAPDFVIVLLGAVILLSAADVTRLQHQPHFLESGFGVWLGEISYSLYMVHYPALLMVIGVGYIFVGSARYAHCYYLFWILAVITAFLLAALLHHTVERPARRWLGGRD